MGRPNTSVSPASAMSHFYNVAVGETKVVVSATTINLYGFLIENNGAATVFIQMFNKATADVTVGTTVPDATYQIPASSNFGKDAQDVAIDHFDKGLVIAVTTSRSNNTAPAADATVHLWSVSKGS